MVSKSTFTSVSKLYFRNHLKFLNSLVICGKCGKNVCSGVQGRATEDFLYFISTLIDFESLKVAKTKKTTGC